MSSWTSANIVIVQVEFGLVEHRMQEIINETMEKGNRWLNMLDAGDP